MSSKLASLMKTPALKVATIVVLVVGAQAVVADCGQIGEDPNSVIKSLCRSKDAEGGYDWNWMVKRPVYGWSVKVKREFWLQLIPSIQTTR
jgi:hypothetical protein